jgi:hypothetical protein
LTVFLNLQLLIQSSILVYETLLYAAALRPYDMRYRNSC